MTPARAALSAIDPRLAELVAPLRRLAVPASILVLALAAAYNMRYGSAQLRSADFPSFYQAGLALRAGHDPYLPAMAFVHAYTPGGNGTYFAARAYVYAPFFALLMVPLTLLPTYPALTVWDLLNVAFLVLAVGAALRAAGLRPGPGLVLALSAAGAVTLPMHREWALGQSDVLVLALVCTALWARAARRPVGAGVLLGAACAIKPELLLLALFLLWKRDFHLALSTLASTAVLALAPFLLLGRAAWSHFWTVWSFWSDQYLPFVHNESPKGVLARLFTVNPVAHPLAVLPSIETVGWVAVVVIVTVLVVAVVSTQPLRRDSLSLLEVGLVTEAIMLVSPLTERPYFMLLLIPLLGLVAWISQARPGDTLVHRAAVTGVVIWVLMLGPVEVAETVLGAGISTGSAAAPIYVLLAPLYLWLGVAAFVLQLIVVARVRGLGVLPAAAGTVRRAPALVASWLRDAGIALALTRRRAA